jgi:ABC-type branched-subunit amino acid transport system substrate-binding protein
VKVGMIGSFKTAALDNSVTIAGAKAAARAINAAGGIGGHEVVIDVCNDQFSVNGAAACGRQMIQDKVIAVTGSSIFDSGFQPMLQQAGIPIVGVVPNSVTSMTGSNVYLTIPGSLFELYGATAYAAQSGLKSVYVSRADVESTAAFLKTVQAFGPKLGIAVTGNQSIPSTTTDMTPFVQQLINSKAQSIVMAYGAAQAVEYAKGAASLNVTNTKFLYTAANLLPADVTNLGSAAANFILGASLPPASATNLPGIQQYLKEMKAEQDSGDSDASPSHLNETTETAWLAIHAITKVMTTNTNTTAAGVTAALATAKNIDLMGLIPPWTPSTTGAAPLTRVDNSSVYILTIKNGQLVLDQPKPIDVRKLTGV